MSKKDNKKQSKTEKVDIPDKDDLNQHLENVKNDKNFVMPPLMKTEFMELLKKSEKEIDEILSSKKDNEDMFVDMRNYYVSMATIGDSIKSQMDKMLSCFQEMHTKHVNSKSGIEDEQNTVAEKVEKVEKNTESESKTKTKEKAKSTKSTASKKDPEPEPEPVKEVKKAKSKKAPEPEPEPEPVKEVKKGKSKKDPEPEPVKEVKKGKSKKEPEPKSESESESESSSSDSSSESEKEDKKGKKKPVGKKGGKK